MSRRQRDSKQTSCSELFVAERHSVKRAEPVRGRSYRTGDALCFSPSARRYFPFRFDWVWASRCNAIRRGGRICPGLRTVFLRGPEGFPHPRRSVSCYLTRHAAGTAAQTRAGNGGAAQRPQRLPSSGQCRNRLFVCNQLRALLQPFPAGGLRSRVGRGGRRHRLQRVWTGIRFPRQTIFDRRTRRSGHQWRYFLGRERLRNAGGRRNEPGSGLGGFGGTPTGLDCRSGRALRHVLR